MREFELSESEFDRVRHAVLRITGISLSESKRELVYSRLTRRLRSLGLRTFTEYCTLVESGDPAERQQLTNAITTNLTAFFREEHHFQQFAEGVLKDVPKGGAAGRRLRVWSAGCSTGEEAYSIAITVKECCRTLPAPNIRILATDIDTNVVASAARGDFAAERLRGLSEERRTRWFEAANTGRDTFHIAAELRELISFKTLNLLDPWPMRGPFDAIFCRNVIIYFDKTTQRELFARMATLQKSGAWLFIGHSEILQGVTDAYRLIGRSAYQRV